MSVLKKRMAMGLGFTVHMQNIDSETDVIMSENFVNNWGGHYARLDIDEAILFQNALLAECIDEYQALEKKAMPVAARFGLEKVGETPNKPNKPTPR